MIQTNYNPREAVLYGLLTRQQQRKVDFIYGGMVAKKYGLTSEQQAFVVAGEYVFYNDRPYRISEYIQMTTPLAEDPEGYWQGFFIIRDSITLVHGNESGTYIFGTMK